MRFRFYLVSITFVVTTILFLFMFQINIYNSSSSNFHLELTKRILNATKRLEFIRKSYNYLEKYPDLLSCSIDYDLNQVKTTTGIIDYKLPVPNNFTKISIIRGVIVYFPLKSYQDYFIEFKWLYRSWIEMQKYESSKWRTDLIVFIDGSETQKNIDKFTGFFDLNCKFENIRKNRQELPMCTLINYTSIGDRKVNVEFVPKFSSVEEEYDYFFDKIDLFDDNDKKLNVFYEKLKDLKHYGYIDSIIMAFSGYKQLNGHYDFLLRTDMDVFLTPLFANWLPKKCNEFVVGGGAYSNTFNMNRLKRISKNLNLEHAFEWNLGSTWYSTPKQFRLAAYLTLISMVYLSNEEFSSVERESKLGVMLWPEWHYGVLLLYGQNIAMNHLISTKQIFIVKLPDLIDYPSGNDKSVFESVHIHVFHGDDLFSKFVFKMGRYDNLTVNEEDKFKTRYYALSTALDARRLNGTMLHQMLINVTNHKN